MSHLGAVVRTLAAVVTGHTPIALPYDHFALVTWRPAMLGGAPMAKDRFCIGRTGTFDTRTDTRPPDLAVLKPPVAQPRWHQVGCQLNSRPGAASASRAPGALGEPLR